MKELNKEKLRELTGENNFEPVFSVLLEWINYIDDKESRDSALGNNIKI